MGRSRIPLARTRALNATQACFACTSADVKEAFALDLYWDPKEEGFVRQPYVSKTEAIVDADPEASRLYKDRLWDLTENKPEKKSRFKRVMDAVCSHTEPCASRPLRGSEPYGIHA